jgi:hypothetical protein
VSGRSSRKTLPPANHLLPALDLNKPFPKGVKYHRIPLNSIIIIIINSRTTLSDSCLARILAVHPAPWSTLFLVAGRARISTHRVRPLFQGHPQTTRLFHLSRPKDRLPARVTTCPRACRIHRRGKCLLILKARRLDLLIMACTVLVDLVCHPNHLHTLCLSRYSQDSRLPMFLFHPSPCQVIRCSLSTPGNLLPTFTRCRHRALV